MSASPSRGSSQGESTSVGSLLPCSDRRLPEGMVRMPRTLNRGGSSGSKAHRNRSRRMGSCGRRSTSRRVGDRSLIGIPGHARLSFPFTRTRASFLPSDSVALASAIMPVPGRSLAARRLAGRRPPSWGGTDRRVEASRLWADLVGETGDTTRDIRSVAGLSDALVEPGEDAGIAGCPCADVHT